MSKLVVGLFFGGRSSEHEISLKSAKFIDQVIDKDKYQLIYVGISKLGVWFSANNLEAVISQLNLSTHPEINLALSYINQKTHLVKVEHHNNQKIVSTTPIDIAFPILHGPYGEDGKIQGLFEMFNLPYVGCNLDSSHLGIDKAIQKTLLRAAKLPVLDFYSFNRGDWQKDRSDLIYKTVKYLNNHFPLFVKPAKLGSSIGISKVKKEVDLAGAVDQAFSFDDKVIIEKGLDQPREIELAILGNEDPIVSDCGEIKTSQQFYSYQAKYQDNTTKLEIPAKIKGDLSHQLQETALKVYKLLGCSGLSRVDMFYDEARNEFWVNEINTMPGFTSVSMYPKLMEYSGIPYGELIDRLIQLGLQRSTR